MTRYIVKHTSRTGKTKRMILVIPTGKHPRHIPNDCPLIAWNPGTRLFYESNGQEVAVITLDRKTREKRITWHRI